MRSIAAVSPVEKPKPADMSLPLSCHSEAGDKEVDDGEERERDIRCLPWSEAEHEGSWVAHILRNAKIHESTIAHDI